MARLLFSLRGVPEDEAAEIRTLLNSHSVDYYETDAGNWGISMPALWVHDDETHAVARQLLDDYQHNRFIQQRAYYEQQKKLGRQRTIWHILLEKPVQVILSLAFITFIIYLSFRLVEDLSL
jgi:hypothetical protein